MKMVAGSSTQSNNKSVDKSTKPAHAARNHAPRFLISDLCSLLESYLESDQVKNIYSAYLFSASAHEGQNAS